MTHNKISKLHIWVFYFIYELFSYWSFTCFFKITTDILDQIFLIFRCIFYWGDII